jgi:carboxyl-terminal processing protease
VRKLLPWLLGALLAIPVAMPAAAPTVASAQSGCLAASPTPAPSAAPLLMPETSREDLFNAVWGAIDQGYLDPAFNGRDWNAIGDEYAPQYLQIEDAWEIYDLTTRMVNELGDDEVQFVSPLILENLPPEEKDYVGIGALVDKSATEDQGAGPRILYVFQGSGAEAAGLQPRDRIVSVDGDPCVTIAAIRGPEGTNVTLGIERPGEAASQVVVERRRIDPTVHPVWKTIGPDGSVGYLRLPSMEGQSMVDGVAQALGELRDDGVRGLVIDARSVGLGGIGVTAAIVSHLLDGNAGTFYSRADTTPMELPKSDLLASFKDLPIVVLVDKVSSGEPERLAWILQSTGRAKVVGQPTPGRTRVIQEIPYDDGSALDLVTVGLELPDGTKLERQPVKPDVTIADDWLAYPEAKDPYLLAALDLLGGSPAASASPGMATTPSAVPSPVPSVAPSAAPSPSAAASPSAVPGPSASAEPSIAPSPSPVPSLAPSPSPSEAATAAPSPEPTPKATRKPRKHR